MQKSIQSKDGRDLILKEDIIKEYESYYRDLLRTKESRTVDEFVAETKVNSEFNVFKLNQDKKKMEKPL